MKGLFKRLSILTASLAMVFGVGLVNNEKRAKAEDNVLTSASGSGTGYARRKITNNGIGWILSIGQSGFLGANNKNSHNNSIPTDDDLPVVSAVDPSASISTTGLYFYYTTTAVANVGSIEFSYTGNSGNTSAVGYVVIGDTLSTSGGEAYTQIVLDENSPTTQGASLGTSGTFTYKFATTNTNAMFYGFVIQTSSYKRMTNGTISLLAGEQQVDVEALNVTTTSFTLTKGETAQIEASVTPENASEKGIIYSVDSGFEDYISVDENGLITAKNVIDAATITVKAKGDESKTATVIVKVEAPSANPTIELINAIGTVEYTDESKAKIDAARTSYDSLDDATKALVTNYQTLVDAESKYEELKQAALVAADKAEAAKVDDLINAIGEIVDYSKKSQVAEARKAYDALTDTQKTYIQSLSILEKAEAELEKYKPLQYEIDTGSGRTLNSNPAEIKTIDALNDVYPTPEGISWIDNTSTWGSKKDVLKLGTGSKKGNVTLKLTNSDYYISKVVVTAQWFRESDSSSLVVNNLTSSLLTSDSVDYTFDLSSLKSQEVDISTDVKRAYIFNIIVEYAKKDINIDHEKVDAVINLINSIGSVEPTLSTMYAIIKAEEAYDELLSAEKELVTNYSTLTTARNTFNSLVKTGNTVSGINLGYTSYDFTIGKLKMNTNIGGNKNCVGFNKDNKSNAILDSTIASAIEGASTSTTGMIAIHAEFYNGFISLDLKATDLFIGNAYILSTEDGGKNYILNETVSIDTTDDNEFKIEATFNDITDFVVVLDASNSTAARFTLSSIVYYNNLTYSDELKILLDQLEGLDSCTNYDDAASVRELLNELSARDQVLFSRATIEDFDADGNIVPVNAEAKLSYMEAYAAHKAKESSNSNVMSILTKDNNISFVLLIGILGLASIAGYYFINKKRMLTK